jgi:DNA-binding MarR family transcriptional regulator
VNAVEVYLLGRKLMKIAESAFAADQPGGELPTSVRMVLVDISMSPGSSIGEITARTGFPQSHVSASVARLREQGVLETSVDAVDGRRTLAAEVASPDREDLAQVIDALEAVAERIIPQALRRTRTRAADVTEAG